MFSIVWNVRKCLERGNDASILMIDTFLLRHAHQNKLQVLSFSKQRDTSLQRAGLNFHTTIS